MFATATTIPETVPGPIAPVHVQAPAPFAVSTTIKKVFPVPGTRVIILAQFSLGFPAPLTVFAALRDALPAPVPAITSLVLVANSATLTEPILGPNSVATSLALIPILPPLSSPLKRVLPTPAPIGAISTLVPVLAPISSAPGWVIATPVPVGAMSGLVPILAPTSFALGWVIPASGPVGHVSALVPVLALLSSALGWVITLGPVRSISALVRILAPFSSIIKWVVPSPGRSWIISAPVPVLAPLPSAVGWIIPGPGSFGIILLAPLSFALKFLIPTPSPVRSITALVPSLDPLSSALLAMLLATHLASAWAGHVLAQLRLRLGSRRWRWRWIRRFLRRGRVEAPFPSSLEAGQDILGCLGSVPSLRLLRRRQRNLLGLLRAAPRILLVDLLAGLELCLAPAAVLLFPVCRLLTAALASSTVAAGACRDHILHGGGREL
mmetsp:Transcript_118024/g.252081  ORF Transcript_118024/g.252081 Transcript_118024/m.252081 type:complete len:439 (-) Transcript_118024:78-1394(-)